MQHAAQALAAPPATPLNVADMEYIYDVDHRNGLAVPTLQLMDIDALGVFSSVMGQIGICPVATGACVASTTGGDVIGFDMYGQYIEETVGAAGTSTIAFYGVLSAPADALWANQFGLPYKYTGAAAAPNADVTVTVPDAEEDARGTFAYEGGDLVATGYIEVEVPFMVDMDEPYGAPYKTRFATADRVASTEFAGTVNSSGVIAITKTLIADDSAFIILSFADGTTLRTANEADTVNATLKPLWMSQYSKVADVDKIVTGVTEHGSPITVNLTGSLV